MAIGYIQPHCTYAYNKTQVMDDTVSLPHSNGFRTLSEYSFVFYFQLEILYS